MMLTETEKQKKKKLYWDRKRNGMCPSCGKNKPKKNYVTCESCLEIDRIKHKKSCIDDYVLKFSKDKLVFDVKTKKRNDNLPIVNQEDFVGY